VQCIILFEKLHSMDTNATEKKIVYTLRWIKTMTPVNACTLQTCACPTQSSLLVIHNMLINSSKVKLAPMFVLTIRICNLTSSWRRRRQGIRYKLCITITFLLRLLFRGVQSIVTVKQSASLPNWGGGEQNSCTNLLKVGEEVLVQFCTISSYYTSNYYVTSAVAKR
jgi:hypothetical protein